MHLAPDATAGWPRARTRSTVRATDAGRQHRPDARPAATWTVDNTAPDTTIDAGPSGIATSDTATFAFSATETGSTFGCTLDGGALTACTSPKTYSGLAEGAHTFTVRATDPAGNTDPSPASRTWTVDTAGADTTIDDVAPTGDGRRGFRAVAASRSAPAQRHGVDLRLASKCRRRQRLGPHSRLQSWDRRAWPRVAHDVHRPGAVDPAGNTDPTSASRTGTVDTTPPDTTIDAGPIGIATSDTATFAFSATETGSTFGCTLDGGVLTACTSPKTYSGLAEGSHTFTVRATDPAGNTDPSPASRTWTIDLQVADTTPPDVALTAPADGASVRGSVTISATAHDDTAVDHVDFLVDDVVVGTDSTDFPYSMSWDSTSLADGPATITAIAVDTSGNRTTSASRTVTVDNTPPDTTIDAGPTGTVGSASASFAFSATETGSTFGCTLDGGALTACTSPQTYSGLAEGAHTFTVRATDPAGNTDPSPASRTWTVDTTAPDTTIDAGPSGIATSDTATFAFSATETGSTFGCTLDGGVLTACTSPKTYSGLAEGAHTFTVRATDPAGNTDPSPASRTWTVDTTAARHDDRRGSVGHRDLGHRHLRLQRDRDRLDLRLHARRRSADGVHLAQDLQRAGRGRAHVHRPGDRPGRQHRPDPRQPDLDHRPAGRRHDPADRGAHGAGRRGVRPWQRHDQRHCPAMTPPSTMSTSSSEMSSSAPTRPTSRTP